MSLGTDHPLSLPTAAPHSDGAPRALSPLVIALGGNALDEDEALPAVAEGAGTASSEGSDHRDDRDRRVAPAVWLTARQLATLALDERPLVITHGNGPQVGRALARAAAAEAEGLAPLPMDIAVAHTQGELGYQLARALDEAMHARDIDRPVVALLTQVAVDADDPALRSPSKPIGAWMSAVQAKRLARTRGWTVRHVADKGWRRVVPSPRPVSVLELPAIRALLAAGTVVITAGGGGIPVVREGAGYRGIAAVIDKDRSSALLARALSASALVIATNVPHVLLDHGTPSERPAHRMRVAEAAVHLAEGQFPPGSMGPKVEAAIDFARATGRPAYVCALGEIERALAGEAGTTITA